MHMYILYMDKKSIIYIYFCVSILRVGPIEKN